MEFLTIWKMPSDFIALQENISLDGCKLGKGDIDIDVLSVVYDLAQTVMTCVAVKAGTKMQK